MKFKWEWLVLPTILILAGLLAYKRLAVPAPADGENKEA